jgi:hypothetical protein
LCSWQHRFTSVNAANLFFAAAQGGWHVSARFRELAATLSLRTGDFRSNVGVMVEFLRLLWNSRWPIPRWQAEALTYAALAGVDAGRTENCVPYYKALQAYVVAGQISLEAWHAITEWYRGHFLPPVIG